MANKLSRAFDWGFYNVWQKIEWALFPLLALGIVGWCLSALYWSPDPVNEKYLYSPGNSPYFLSNKTSDVLWFTQVDSIKLVHFLINIYIFQKTDFRCPHWKRTQQRR